MIFSLTRIALIALVAGSQLAGCSAISSVTKSVSSAIGLGPRAVTPDWRAVTITASDDANGNSPVAIDLVFVRDQALLDTLTKTPAARWFSSRTDIVQTFPEGVGVLSYELVPRQSIRVPEAAFEKQRAFGVLAFASYPAPGEHRLRLKLDAEAYLVQLGANGFQASEVKPAAAR
jgi:type VI secretion system protein